MPVAMGGKQSGRNLRLTPEVHATIVKHLKAGAFKRHAAMAAGVSGEALKTWLRRGDAGEKRFVAFARDVQRAIAEDAIRNQAVISAAAVKHHEGDWRAAAYNLERKHPSLYGRNAGTLIGVNVEHPNGEADSARTRVEFYLPDNTRGLPSTRVGTPVYGPDGCITAVIHDDNPESNDDD